MRSPCSERERKIDCGAYLHCESSAKNRLCLGGWSKRIVEPYELSGPATAGFSPPPPEAPWEQVNIGLVRTGADALPSARAMFSSLSPSLDLWNRAGSIQGWFFMRKPPDVRLRVCLRSKRSDARATLDRKLHALREQGKIRGHYWSRYLPEQDRFGGAAAMALAHAYFHLDSILWLHLDHLGDRALRKLPADRLLPAVLQHMFLCCCGTDKAPEAWRCLAHQIGDLPPFASSDIHLPPVSLEVLSGDDGLHPGERLALRSYVDSNQSLGKALIALPADTRCEHPIPLIAATIALFNLNRHGFPGERSGPMARSVLASLAD